jgi:citrate lyase beta subunit
MYITNRPAVARIVENAGVDRIFVDMEYIGKDKRQAGLDTVKSCHTISDILAVKSVVEKAEVLVRINPIHDRTEEYPSSEDEINQAIEAGANIIMLPMFKTMEEIDLFLNYIHGRCKTMLLVETPEAVNLINEPLRCFMKNS